MNDTQSEMQAIVGDPSTLIIAGSDIRDAVFVIPVDAPVPSDLSDLELPSGSLYRRLVALDSPDQGGGFAFVPVAGAELLALDRVWRSLTRAKRVFALFELPGARYDVLFTQAVRQIGISRLDWPAVAESLALRLRAQQRTKDATPYAVAPSVQKLAPEPSGFGMERLPTPEASDADS